MRKKIKGNLPAASPEDAKRILDLLDKATVRFEGDFDELEQALGMYLIGRSVGWKVLVLIHNKRTIRKYEEILGINIREAFPEVGVDAERSHAWRVASALSNFWKAVSGETKIEHRRVLE